MIANQRNLLPYSVPFIVFGALWYLLIAHLSAYWATNAEYSYGWFGPVLCAYLFFLRWVTRPGGEPARSRWAKWLLWIVGFAVLPTWLVEQPNPDWRLMGWLLGLEVVVLSLCAIYFAGGRPWLRHFAFSISLILTTVPWPGDLEVFITQGLMHVVTAIAVTLLNFFHIPAVQHGNLIALDTGLLGIAEACSGIQSLQATFMAALFLGELYQAPWSRRVVLVLCGALIAFACNVGRVFLLAWVAAQQGMQAVSKWHDPAGFTILGICFVAVWGLARLLSGPALPLQRPSHNSAPNQLPRGLLVGLGAWLLLTLLGTETWYRAHKHLETPRWSFEWPASKAGFSELELPEPTVEALRFDQGRAASWTDGDGSRWTAFFFKWAAGAVSSRMQARWHRPDVCFPTAGFKLQADRGTITIQTKGLSLPFHALEFDYDGQPAHVFFCLRTA